MRVLIQKKRRSKTPSAAILRRRLCAMLAAAGEEGAELSVTFIGDPEMAELNGQYRNKPYPTDVLSFPQREGDGAGVESFMLGDVVISVDTAARQAREAGHSVEREIMILLAHGLAHLLGYDHELGPKDARAQKRMEKTLLEAI